VVDICNDNKEMDPKGVARALADERNPEGSQAAQTQKGQSSSTSTPGEQLTSGGTSTESLLDENPSEERDVIPPSTRPHPSLDDLSP
jgi:hypothetical protein